MIIFVQTLNMPFAVFFSLTPTRSAIIQQVIETHVRAYSVSFYRMKGCTLTRSGNVLRSVLTHNCYQRCSSGLSLQVCFDPLLPYTLTQNCNLSPIRNGPAFLAFFVTSYMLISCLESQRSPSRTYEGSSLLMRLDLVNLGDEFFPLDQVRIFNAEVETSRKFHREHTIITRRYERLSRCSSTEQVSSSVIKKTWLQCAPMLRLCLIGRFFILLAANILILQQILSLLPRPVKFLILVLITKFRPYHLASSAT